jgi:cytochrome b pre-mRNA-processing protein 3
MHFLKYLGGRRADLSEPALGLYRAAVAAARAPILYTLYGVPDTPDGRFDLIALHVFLALRRLKREQGLARNEAGALAQALTDLMFADMDRNLREMGVGDLAVGKQVKALAAAFRGRVAVYDAALEEAGDDTGLAEALRRNLFRSPGQPPGEGVMKLALHVRAADGMLAGVPWNALAAGNAVFPPPPDATD